MCHCVEFRIPVFENQKNEIKNYIKPVSPDAADGPFIGPSVEIRGKKNKKKYISFLPPVYHV